MEKTMKEVIATFVLFIITYAALVALFSLERVL